MLPQKNRLRRGFGVGKKVEERKSPSFLLKVFASKESQKKPYVKVSLLVPKKTEKLATKRNTIRRVGYEALKDFLPNVSPNHTLVFLTLRPLGKETKKNLRALCKKEFEELLSQAKLL